ncbi:MAG: diguanylate cyclase domain-containing protein, partial [Candidatus Limnocylindrales bacterium]
MTLPAAELRAGTGPTDALRLVRLRLGLAMAAMAVLPIVLAVLILPGLTGPDADAQARLAASSGDVSAALAANLGRIRSALLITAADPQVAGVVSGPGALPATVKASVSSIVGLLGPVVSSASLRTIAGVERLRVAGGAIAAVGAPRPADPILRATASVAAGEVYRTQPVPSASGTTMAMSAPVRAKAGGPVVGIVRFDVSVDRLLASAETAARAWGGYALVVDRTTGEVIADGRTAVPAGQIGGAGSGPTADLPDVGSALGGAVARAGRAWATLFGDGWGVGLAPVSVAVPGFADWTVVVAQPTPTGGIPIQLALAALVLLAAIAGLAIWMARQVVQPAAALDHSRQELAALYEVARRDALVDPLTGLGNHRAFQETLGRELEQARRHRYPVTLMLLDLDDFKQVNDRAGHASGDAILSTFGLLLTGGVRRGDGAFRIGGDEFAVVMPHTDGDGAEIVARRLLSTALEPGAGTGPRRAPISFSAGIASAPDHGTVAGELSA